MIQHKLVVASGMARQYRAFISAHITAEDDGQARTIAERHAGAVRDEDRDVVGHLELLGEVADGSITVERVVWKEPSFARQLPREL